MADFENAINLDQMDDDDVRGLILQRLDEDADFDVETVDVEVRDGHVTVDGRVGTESERQHVEEVLGLFGAIDFDNNLVIDETTRAEQPEDADEALVQGDATTAPMGEADDNASDTAEHLKPDDSSDLYGTRNPQKAIEEGKSYTPPESPTQKGITGDERH